MRPDSKASLLRRWSQSVPYRQESFKDRRRWADPLLVHLPVLSQDLWDLVERKSAPEEVAVCLCV